MKLVQRMGAILTALLLIAGFAALPDAVLADNVTYLTLSTGHSTVLTIPGLRRVAVGDSGVAGVVPIGTSQLIVNAKGPGHTTIIVWHGSEQTAYEVTVTQSGADDLAQILRAAIPFPDIQVVSFGKTVLIRGTVADMQQYVDLDNLIKRFNGAILPGNSKSGGGDSDKVIYVNAVTVAHSLGSIQKEFQNVPGVRELQIEPDGEGNVIVSGQVHDQVQAEQVLARAKTLAGTYLSAKGTLIDRLQIATSSEVSIKVYVLEVDKSALNQLGLNLQTATPNDPVNPTTYSIGGASVPIIEGATGAGKALTIAPFFRTVRLAPTIDLIIQNGSGRILSAPDLVTTPGNKATFLVGGQIPYVYSTGLGQVSVVFKNYGVQLAVTPTILPDGSIETQINPDISNLDYQNAVQLAGYYIPALKESTISTDLITRSGESVVMGGLLERIEQRTLSKVPILSSIPILGKLFTDARYQDQETDVVFVMTPQIITQ